MAARRRQHHKGRKRPRAWHRSKSSSLRYWRALQHIDRVIKEAAR